MSGGELFASWASGGVQQMGLRGADLGAWQTQTVAPLQGTCTAGLWPTGNGDLMCFSQSTRTNLVMTPLNFAAGAGAARVLDGVTQPTASPDSARVFGYSATAEEIVVDAGLELRGLTLATETSGQGGVSQVVDLSGVQGRPVLSFAYALPVSRTVAGDTMAIHLQASGAPTPTVIPLEASAFLQTRRIDLSAWTGSQLQVSIVVTDTANGSSIAGQVGDLHIHDRRSAVIDRVSLSAETLIIAGGNFQPGVTVTVAGHAVPGVTRLDAGNLSAPMPPGIPPGRHTVRVTNPDGTRATSLVAYRVNQFVYLPTIRNWANPNR